LISAALLSAFGFNLCSNAFIAYTVPGRMFAPAFRDMGLATTNLSRVLEDGATMSAPLIPWNSGAVYVSSTLGVPTLLYAPFAFSNWIAPLFDLLWAWTGYFIPEEEAGVGPS
jgi:NhaC family Na+:H+ antiporter